MLSTVVINDYYSKGVGWYRREAQVKMALRADYKVAARMKDNSGAGE